MKNVNAWIFLIVLLVVCGQTAQSKVDAPTVDIWTAAAQGNLEAIKRHVSAGTDLNAKEPTGGSTPLIVAALFGQTEAAGLLIEKGANVNVKNNEGSTALHTAAAVSTGMHPGTCRRKRRSIWPIRFQTACSARPE